MRALAKIGELAGRFGRACDGNFGMMAAITAPLLVLAAGYGLNIAQLSLVRSNLHASLDAAVTSTARDLTTGAIREEDAQATVEAFLLANGTRGFAATDRISLDRLTVDRTARTLSASATVNVDLAFPIFDMSGPRDVSAVSSAIYSDKRIEVVMMLDVTGSMEKRGRTDKIGDLKAAASNAVNQLLNGNRGAGERVRVGLVPYAEAVNAGAMAQRVVFTEQRGGPDLPPAVGLPLPARVDNCTTERKLLDGSADFSNDSPYTVRFDPARGQQYPALVNRDDRMGDCPTAAVVPLTADRQKLLDAIDGFRASGWTGGGIAAQWGYYMLSPQWRRPIADSGLGSGPADFDDRRVSKIAILMTDGAFNTAFAGVASNPRGGQGTISPRHAERLCSNMKRDGIEIFTIGFALPAGESSAARSVLRNCASNDTGAIRHFHEAANGDQLDATFREIVANVERLALTQ